MNIFEKVRLSKLMEKDNKAEWIKLLSTKPEVKQYIQQEGENIVENNIWYIRQALMADVPVEKVDRLLDVRYTDRQKEVLLKCMKKGMSIEWLDAMQDALVRSWIRGNPTTIIEALAHAYLSGVSFEHMEKYLKPNHYQFYEPDKIYALIPCITEPVKSLMWEEEEATLRKNGDISEDEEYCNKYWFVEEIIKYSPDQIREVYNIAKSLEDKYETRKLSKLLLYDNFNSDQIIQLGRGVRNLNHASMEHLKSHTDCYVPADGIRIFVNFLKGNERGASILKNTSDKDDARPTLFDDDYFTKEQQNVILEAFATKDIYDVIYIADRRYTKEQMELLLHNVNKKEIRDIVFNPEFTLEQMTCLFDLYDKTMSKTILQIVSKPWFTVSEMEGIASYLVKKGVKDMTNAILGLGKFNYEQVLLILKGLEDLSVDQVCAYAKPNYSLEHMKWIYEAYKNGVPSKVVEKMEKSKFLQKRHEIITKCYEVKENPFFYMK